VRTLTPALAAELESGVTTLCLCWTITTTAGKVLCFTDHDRDLEFEDLRFPAASGLEPTAIEAALGLSVDNLEAQGALGADGFDAAALERGDYDGAAIAIHLVDWRNPARRLLLRRGTLGEVTRRGASFTAEIRGLTHRLGINRGRIFQHACDAVLGDRRCRVVLDDPRYRAEGSVAELIGRHSFMSAGLEGFADQWFARGTLRWEDGGTAIVKSSGRDRVTLWQEAPEGLAAGDRFRITAGCDKQFATCRDKFGNHLNFRGFPQMPGNDALL
jgi:uncharacterized phage protein (TIGR02218 family)